MRFFVLALASLVATAFATESIITADIFSGRKLQTSTTKDKEYTPERKKAEIDACNTRAKSREKNLCKGATCTAAEEKLCIKYAETYESTFGKAETSKSVGIRYCGNEDVFGSYFTTVFSEVEGCEGFVKAQVAMCDAVATCALPGGGSTTIIIVVVAGVAVVVLAAVGVFLYKKKKSKAKVASQAASGAA